MPPSTLIEIILPSPCIWATLSLDDEQKQNVLERGSKKFNIRSKYRDEAIQVSRVVKLPDFLRSPLQNVIGQTFLIRVC